MNIIFSLKRQELGTYRAKETYPICFFVFRKFYLELKISFSLPIYLCRSFLDHVFVLWMNEDHTILFPFCCRVCPVHSSFAVYKIYIGMISHIIIPAKNIFKT